MKHLFIVCTLLLLAACGSSEPPSAQAVVEAFQDAGIELTDIAEGERNPESPLPNSYDEHVEFTIVALGDDGGQVFTCSTKENCDAIYNYFELISGFAGPYRYQSGDGRVVAQLNSGLTPEQAAAFEDVINGL